MLSVVLCSEHAQQSSDTQNTSGLGAFQLEKLKVHCGLMEEEKPDFDPHSPEHADDVLIKTLAFSCNYRDKGHLLSWVDLATSKAREGDPNIYYSCVGSEFVGEVIAKGSAVTDFEVGDRVIQDAAFPLRRDGKGIGGLSTNHASNRFHRVNQYKLLKIPQTFPIPQAAAFTIAGQTVYGMINRLNLQPGSNVLVTSAKSNTSTFAISALKNKFNVYALSSSDAHKEEILRLGAKELLVVQHDQESFFKDPQKAGAIIQETGGFDAVIDPFIDLHLNRLTEYLKIGAKYITCGIYQQYAAFEKEAFQFPADRLPYIFGDMIMRKIEVIGHCLGSSEDLEEAIADFDKGRVELLIDQVYRGDEVAAFFEHTYNVKTRLGKVVYQYE